MGYLISVMVGMARRAVPARAVAGGTNIRATFAIEGVAPLHAARTSQRDVPTTPRADARTSPGTNRGPVICRCPEHSTFHPFGSFSLRHRSKVISGTPHQ